MAGLNHQVHRELDLSIGSALPKARRIGSIASFWGSAAAADQRQEAREGRGRRQKDRIETAVQVGLTSADRSVAAHLARSAYIPHWLIYGCLVIVR
jgi:hypothetical protein